MNSDLFNSFVRTITPVLVGLFLSFGIGEYVDEVELNAFVSTGATVAYYGVARLLESQNSQFGVLLGSRTQPNYGVEDSVTVEGASFVVDDDIVKMFEGAD